MQHVVRMSCFMQPKQSAQGEGPSACWLLPDIFEHLHGSTVHRANATTKAAA